MGFFSSYLSPNGLSFWRDRSLVLEKELERTRERYEKELKDERIRNRKREDALQDKILVSKGFPPITPKIEKELGFEFNPPKPKELTDAEKLELKYFVDNAVNQGKSESEAKEYWMNNVRK